MIDRIGIEKEYWLIDNVTHKIMEPAIFGFPHDDFGFLIELRTTPCTNPKDLFEDFMARLHDLQVKAKSWGCHLSDKPNMPKPEELIKQLSKKYHYDQLKDLTANINVGVSCSHATGVFDGYLSCGIHVHFSRHNKFGRRVQLPITTIVKKMDWNFRSIIKDANRISGEYELKPYGFEYRSLPANAPVKNVVKRAFKILESV